MAVSVRSMETFVTAKESCQDDLYMKIFDEISKKFPDNIALKSASKSVDEKLKNQLFSKLDALMQELSVPLPDSQETEINSKPRPKSIVSWRYSTVSVRMFQDYNQYVSFFKNQDNNFNQIETLDANGNQIECRTVDFEKSDYTRWSQIPSIRSSFATNNAELVPMNFWPKSVQDFDNFDEIVSVLDSVDSQISPNSNSSLNLSELSNSEKSTKSKKKSKGFSCVIKFSVKFGKPDQD